MAISFVGSTYATLKTNAKPITVNFSGGNWSGGSVQAGDIVIAHIVNNYGDEVFTINTSGYNLVTPNPLDAGSIDETALITAYKVMGSTPDTSIEVTFSSSATYWGAIVFIYVLRGVDPTTPIDVTTTTAVGYKVSLPPNPPAITPVTAGAMVLTLIGYSNRNYDESATQPSGYSDQRIVHYNSSSSYYTHAGVAKKLWSGSGAEDPGNWDIYQDGNTSWACVTMALRPYIALGPTNLKSYNTNLKANIKTINTNPIANVKSLNTNV